MNQAEPTEELPTVPSEPESELPANVPMHDCTIYSGSFLINYELVRQMENSEYPFNLQGVNDVLFRIDSYDCIIEDEVWGFDAAFLSAEVEPLNQTAASPMRDFLVFDAIAGTFAMRNYFECIYGEASHGSASNLPPPMLNRITITSDDDQKYRLSSPESGLLPLDDATVLRLHSAQGGYIELNGTTEPNIPTFGVVQFLQNTLGAHLGQLPASVGVGSSERVQIAGAGSDCRYDETDVDRP